MVRYVARHGARRVDRIVLLSAALSFPARSDGNPAEAGPAAFDGMQAAIAADRPEFLRTLHERFFGAAGAALSVSEGVRQWMFSVSMQAGLPAPSGCLTVLTGTDIRGDLSGIDVPTLLVHGGADQLAPLGTTGREATGLLPHSELRVIEGAPRGLRLTHRDQVNAALLAFFEQPGRLWGDNVEPRSAPLPILIACGTFT